ncbi:hypothetical protein HDU96_006371 [Phlyctochytrium bullatum]|nr:hypothetical protein HDU96_006371 [Phlyctochytrium bullatum]
MSRTEVVTAHRPKMRSYEEARDAFTQLALAASAELTEISVAEDPATSTRLVTHGAYIGPASPTSLLIHISGTHGVEAIPGSAIQCQLLELLRRHTPGSDDPASLLGADCGLVLVHVVNPWGTHHKRWMNENNVNLMSNWTGDPAKDLVGAPEGYQDIQALVNPPYAPTWTDGPWFAVSAAWMLLQHGFKRIAAVAGFPQYVNPKGIFYGGARKEPALDRVEAYLARFVGREGLKRVGVIDIHTGIGDEFGGTHLLALRSHRHAVAAFRAHPTLKDVKTLDDGLFRNNVFDRVKRLVDDAAARDGRDPMEVYGLHLDFGTYSTRRSLFALVQENQCFHYSPEGREMNAYRERHWEESFPDDPVWLGKVVEGGVQVAEAMVEVLRRGGGGDDGVEKATDTTRKAESRL